MMDNTYVAFSLPFPLGLGCASVIATYSVSCVLYRYDISFSNNDLN
jgi:hypothetical protein